MEFVSALEDVDLKCRLDRTTQNWTYFGNGTVIDNVAIFLYESMYKSADGWLVGKVQNATDIHGGVYRSSVERVLLVYDAHLQMDIYIAQLLMHFHREVQMRVRVVIGHLMAEQLLLAPQLYFVELGPQHFLLINQDDFKVYWRYIFDSPQPGPHSRMPRGFATKRDCLTTWWFDVCQFSQDPAIFIML